jgi:hypothetical protein
MAGPADSLVARVEALDTTLFDHVHASLRNDDRRSLLALHAACREAYGTFAYLEIGSHLGGSLQALVADPACTAIVSIDPRAAVSPDERGRPSVYEDNSTEAMLAGLAKIPGADVGKIVSVEASTEDLRPRDVRAHGVPALAFVDGEHTDEACLRDARFVREVLGDAGCIAFHDPEIVYRGIAAFLEELENGDVRATPYLLPYSIFVVELGEPRLARAELVRQRRDANWRGYLFALHENDRYRLLLQSRAVRLLQRLGRIKV